MRSPFRRKMKLLEAKWLRNEEEDMGRNSKPKKSEGKRKMTTNESDVREKFVPTYQGNMGEINDFSK